MNNDNNTPQPPSFSSSSTANYNQTMTTPTTNYTKLPNSVSVPAHLHRSTNTASYAAPESGSLLARAQETKDNSLPSVAPYLVLFTNSIVPLRLSEAVRGMKTNNDGTTEDPKQEEDQSKSSETPPRVACVLPIRGCIYKKRMEHEVSFARRTAISLLRRYIGLPGARQIQAFQQQLAHLHQHQQHQHPPPPPPNSQTQHSVQHNPTHGHSNSMAENHPKPPTRSSVAEHHDTSHTQVNQSDSILHQHSAEVGGDSYSTTHPQVSTSASQQFQPYHAVPVSQHRPNLERQESHPKIAKTWSFAKAAMSFLDRYVNVSEERRDIEQQLNSLTVFNDRVGKFFDGWEEPRPVELLVCVGGQMVTRQIVFPKSGHFEVQIRFTPEELSEFCRREILEKKQEFKIHKTFTWLSYRVSLVNEPSQMIASDRIMLMKPEGLSIVSDIDDTIKVSQVASIRSLLTNTFSSNYRSVEGMAKVYKAWEKKFGCAFHYVSASPWALYEPLVQFIHQNGFPKGSFHLRDFNWKDSGFLYLFTEATIRNAKTQEILRLIEAFPARTFILVGDSGESDPELYAAIAKEHPQVRKILIRDHGNRMTVERVNLAFRDISPDRWNVFTDSTELYNSIKTEDADEDSESDQDTLLDESTGCNE